ncbi:MAG TPA: tandem-95 repeat protein, partial [Pyrinomonadaceae bacterium]|nr:tandem-95 repeat protein [Pyrinomonadaceae bacterium]
PQYALSYNNDKGTPNWTSWHLDSSWTTGVADRQNDFRPDETLPAGFKRVASGYNFNTYGFDRGHMVPSADRTSSEEDNSATFLMTNMVPQASGNNQGPWADLENHLRTLLGGTANELYVLSGGHGTGGTSTTGNWDSINDTAGNSVAVPNLTWKVVMVLPRANGDDVARVNDSTRTFAVTMPNKDNIRNDDWRKYLATVDQVEALTGYDFFSNVPEAVQAVIESKLDEEYDTAPTAAGQTVTTAEDNAKAVTLSAADFNVNNALAYTVVMQPAHGELSGTGASLTYTPHSDYHGPDSFTFKANDGAKDSNTATVQINVTPVNDAPVASEDAATTDEDSAVTVDVLSNDTDVEGDALSLASVGGATNGTVAVVNNQAVFTPAANYHGPASFTYTVSDGHGGTADATVTLTINSVNDGPTAGDDAATTDEDTPVTVDVRANDADADGDALSVSNVTGATKGSTAVTADGRVLYTPNPNANGADSFTYTVSDGQGGTQTANVAVQINPVNDAPTLAGVPSAANVNELSALAFTAEGADVDGQALTFSLAGAPAGASINPSTGEFSWTPTEAQGGTGAPFNFQISVTDGTLTATANVSVNVNEVNQGPTLAPLGDKSVALGATLTFNAAGADADLPAQALAYSLTGAVPAGASVDPSTGAFTWTPTAAQVGQVYTFGVRVTDAGGLFAEEVIRVGVGYTWSGVLQPVNADGSSVFKLGRTVPVKFQLTGASAGLTNAVARLYVAKVSNNVVGTETEAGSTSNATEGNLFRYDATSGQYVFNLDTGGLTAGTYQARVDTGDGVLRTFGFALRP